MTERKGKKEPYKSASKRDMDRMVVVCSSVCKQSSAVKVKPSSVHENVLIGQSQFTVVSKQ